ncbi:porin [Roseicyclus marinus]|uniref:porin n=1 Tax=Roseicyclus marinus TaxID=2161673 RepID=UPI00240EBB99|nr:porin [Roseicyclus marinus]MDG3041072.1 porin [Roseicyclus marinus]
MKKVLFATTALVAFAGAAAADVTLSGSAEMGIAGSNSGNTAFYQSVDVRFSLSGTTDNGLSFGAVIDLEDAVDQADITDINGAFADFTVFVSGDFGRLTMGDTDGALDWANDEVNTARNAGSINDAETGHLGYFSGATFDNVYGGQILRYDYSVAGFGIAVSAEVDGSNPRSGDASLQLGLTYDLDIAGGALQFGLGFANVDDANRTSTNTNTAGANLAGTPGFSAVSFSALAALDMGFSAAVNYLDINDDGYFGGDGEFIGVGVGYNFDAITVSANWGEYDWAATANQRDREGYGIAASYNLGGGLSAHAGYGVGKNTNNNALAGALNVDISTFSLGLAMSF